MTSAVLDVPRPAARRPAPAVARPPRLPVTVAAAGLLAVVQALGLLALGLAGLDGVFGTGVRPSGALVAGSLLLLAGWVVLAAGGGASLVDGAGRGLLVGVSCAEIVLLVVLGTAGLLGAEPTVAGGLPLPGLALVALGVPTGKLLLATSPSAAAWVATGGRPRPARRAVPAVEHRDLRLVTVACIGLALTAVALLGTPAAEAPAPSTAAVVDAP
ncbi:hypothetical protein [Modestobacter roseus]|uniref:Uncharacterized protein n=1 Tax=Modestobacter roseus TaxID=1181884 RepID=A0A562IKP8_9ACTN|nr:hypothetical protein [Modestobacter roseus]TWH71520.1 hypothetical protein JD78_00016 [Modestobacter roseus]